MPLISIWYFPLNHEWLIAMTMVGVDILGGRASILMMMMWWTVFCKQISLLLELMMMMCFVNRYPCSFALMGAVLISLLVATKFHREVLVCLQCIAQGCIFCCWPLYYILYMMHYLD